jgi:3-phenylpropionate/cinnamic acid dioxygenase small subunit
MAQDGMSDYEAIRQTIAEYCQHYDDWRFDDFEQIWTEDATFAVEGRDAPIVGNKNIAAYLEKRVSATRNVEHPIENIHGSFAPIIRIDGKAAEARADYLAFRARDGQLVISSGGRYIFRLVRHDDRWRISELLVRLLAPDLVRPHPAGVAWPGT